MRDRKITTLTFEVKAAPLSKPRMTQRDKRRKGVIPRPPVARYWAWVEAVQWAYKQCPDRPSEPHTGPVRLGVHFFMSLPKSLMAEKRYEATPHLKRPDWKNLFAGVEDALQGLAYKDDSQMWSPLPSYKVWSRRPGATIIIELHNDLEEEK